MSAPRPDYAALARNQKIAADLAEVFEACTFGAPTDYDLMLLAGYGWDTRWCRAGQELARWAIDHYRAADTRDLTWLTDRLLEIGVILTDDQRQAADHSPATTIAWLRWLVGWGDLRGAALSSRHVTPVAWEFRAGAIGNGMPVDLVVSAAAAGIAWSEVQAATAAHGGTDSAETAFIGMAALRGWTSPPPTAALYAAAAV